MKRNFSLVLVVAMIQLVLVSQSFADPIHDAAKGGDTAEVTRLIAEDRANLEAPGQNGKTPLHFAAAWGHTATVQALVASGANVEARGRNGHTPLHYAAANGHTATTQALIAADANVNAVNEGLRRAGEAFVTDRNGLTPLQMAQKCGYARTVAAFQPQAIAQIHTQAALSHTAAGNHRLAARSHTRAALALPGSIDAANSTHLAARSFSRAGEHLSAATIHSETATLYSELGKHRASTQNQSLAAHAYTRFADIQAAVGDFASAVEHYGLAHAAHTTAGNHEAAGLSHRFATLLAPAVLAQEHLASAHEHAQAMETHFETAEVRVGEIRSHRGRGEEAAAALAEAEGQASASLESANRSEVEAVAAFEAALVALDGALEGAKRAGDEAQVADARAAGVKRAREELAPVAVPVAQLSQYAALEDSLRTQMVSVSRKIDETHASAVAGHASVSAARGI